jgi:hypothetical protein
MRSATLDPERTSSYILQLSKSRFLENCFSRCWSRPESLRQFFGNGISACVSKIRAAGLGKRFGPGDNCNRTASRLTALFLPSASLR